MSVPTTRALGAAAAIALLFMLASCAEGEAGSGVPRPVAAVVTVDDAAADAAADKSEAAASSSAAARSAADASAAAAEASAVALAVAERAAREQADREQAAREQAARERAEADAAAAAARDAEEAASETQTTEPDQVSACDSNYSGCVPIASDVDCEGGSGNGPEYVRGPVTVIGDDIYGLDSDDDGIGCET